MKNKKNSLRTSGLTRVLVNVPDRLESSKNQRGKEQGMICASLRSTLVLRTSPPFASLRGLIKSALPTPYPLDMAKSMGRCATGEVV